MDERWNICLQYMQHWGLPWPVWLRTSINMKITLVQCKAKHSILHTSILCFIIITIHLFSFRCTSAIGADRDGEICKFARKMTSLWSWSLPKFSRSESVWSANARAVWFEDYCVCSGAQGWNEHWHKRRLSWWIFHSSSFQTAKEATQCVHPPLLHRRRQQVPPIGATELSAHSES